MRLFAQIVVSVQFRILVGLHRLVCRSVHVQWPELTENFGRLEFSSGDLVGKENFQVGKGEPGSLGQTEKGPAEAQKVGTQPEEPAVSGDDCAE